MTDPGSYRDQVKVTFIQLRDNYRTEVVDSYEVVIHPHGNIDLDWLNAELENLFTSGRPGDTQRMVHTSYTLHQKRSDVHVGAAGATAEFIVQTAANIADMGIDNALSLGIGALLAKLQQRGFDVRHGKCADLTDEEASHAGLRLIETQFNVPFSDLKLRSVGIDENKFHTTSAEGPDGSVYNVTFQVCGGETKMISRNRELP